MCNPEEIDRIAFQEEDYPYKGENFVIKVFRTAIGLEARSYWNGEEFPKGAVQMSAQMESQVRYAGMFKIMFENEDHLKGLIDLAKNALRIVYDNRR